MRLLDRCNFRFLYITCVVFFIISTLFFALLYFRRHERNYFFLHDQMNLPNEFRSLTFNFTDQCSKKYSKRSFQEFIFHLQLMK